MSKPKTPKPPKSPNLANSTKTKKVRKSRKKQEKETGYPYPTSAELFREELDRVTYHWSNL